MAFLFYLQVEERKRKLWAELAEQLASEGAPREWRDVKKKWADLKSQALRKKAAAKLTGKKALVKNICSCAV